MKAQSHSYGSQSDWPALPTIRVAVWREKESHSKPGVVPRNKVVQGTL